MATFKSTEYTKVIFSGGSGVRENRNVCAFWQIFYPPFESKKKH
jgi:hypothetical protein